MYNTENAYFLAANSADGFVSYFNKNYSAENGWRAIIIKGGPGTGKSRIMRGVAKSAANMGKFVTLCPCSSDPHSLDGVILEDDKKIILDGTAPHIVEPMHPGICEEILNTGMFWNAEKLIEHRTEILAIMGENRNAHKKASHYIAAAGQLLKSNFSICLANTDLPKVFEFAAKLGAKHITKGKGFKEQCRFLGGITPVGYVKLYGTVAPYKNKIIITDEHGAVSSVILSSIRDIAIKNGQEIITVKNPVLPYEKTDAVILPELNTVFIVENKPHDLPFAERRIHAERFISNNQTALNRNRLQFNKKAAESLLANAVECLAEAKKIHDELEKYYVDAMDFNALNKASNNIIADFVK